MEYRFNITIRADDSKKAKEQLLFLLKGLELKVIEIENVEMLKWFQLLVERASKSILE